MSSYTFKEYFPSSLSVRGLNFCTTSRPPDGSFKKIFPYAVQFLMA